MRRLRDYSLCLCLLLLWPLAVNADDSWRQIQTEARGQTVWFNAWGGDPAVNRYLAWVSEEVKRYYAIDLRIVPVADAADAVKRIQTEAQAGRRQGGSVDLLWINGENFRTLKQANLLLTGWAESLPNWRYVDLQKPVREDFSVATEGAESPWGSAQLTFIARRGQTPQPPTSPQALLAFARAHPGSVTYPRPPDFTGTALLEQLLIALTDQPAALRQPPQTATFAAVTAPLWRYLDALHPALWRAGKDFPASPARMDAMLNQGPLRLSLTTPVDEAWNGPAALDGKRIATSYPHLLKRYLDQKGISFKSCLLNGSVEVAPRAGLADAICDLVSTGATLEANGLREVEVIYRSKACLIQRDGEMADAKQQLIDRLLTRIQGVIQARESKYIMMHAPTERLEEVVALLPGAERPTILPLAGDKQRVAMHMVSSETLFWETMEKLKALGASSILVLPIEKMME